MNQKRIFVNRGSLVFVTRFAFLNRVLARVMAFSLFFSFALILGCGHLTTPEYDDSSEYKPQGKFSMSGEYSSQTQMDDQKEFSTPEEFYSSDKVLKNPKSTQRKGRFLLQWPVNSRKINRGFSKSSRHMHLGLDLAGKKGDPIYAAHDGTIIYAGSGFRGYGKMIILEYDKRWATLYGHLSKFNVKIGQYVKVGTIIGRMGRTGHATGVHLHFELMENQIPVDPRKHYNTTSAALKPAPQLVY